MNICGHCLEEKPLPYRVISDHMNIAVCADCACQAYQLAQQPGQVGQIRVEIVEEENKG